MTAAELEAAAQAAERWPRGLDGDYFFNDATCTTWEEAARDLAEFPWRVEDG